MRHIFLGAVGWFCGWDQAAQLGLPTLREGCQLLREAAHLAVELCTSHGGVDLRRADRGVAQQTRDGLDEHAVRGVARDPRYALPSRSGAHAFIAFPFSPTHKKKTASLAGSGPKKVEVQII